MLIESRDEVVLTFHGDDIDVIFLVENRPGLDLIMHRDEGSIVPSGDGIKTELSEK